MDAVLQDNRNVEDLQKIENHADLALVITKLTEKERSFAEEFVVCKNKSKEARRAGYDIHSAGVIGFENYKKHKIKLYIDYLFEERKKEAEVLTDDLLIQIKNISLVDGNDLFDEDGNVKKPVDIDPDTRRAINGIKIRTTTKEVGDAIITTEEIEYKLPDKNKALELLMRHKGELTDKKIHEVGKSMADLLREIEDADRNRDRNTGDESNS